MQGLEVVIQDAAHVVRQRTESIAEARALPWNAIFLDVYDSNCAVPPHLATLGFIGDCRRCLAEGVSHVAHVTGSPLLGPTRIPQQPVCCSTRSTAHSRGWCPD